MTHPFYDCIIIGAGAAGLLCASEAGARGRSVLLLDHAEKPGEKIRISGGGRCNFTNLYCGPQNFLSQNSHFCKSALAGFTPQDFMDLLEQYGIAWHEKTLGQLFCDGSATQIISMLLDQCAKANVELVLQSKIENITRGKDGFLVQTNTGDIRTNAVVVACGGRSIPKMGASGFGYDLARQFGMNVIATEPALVPLCVARVFGQSVSDLAGLSLRVRVSCAKQSFDEALLFTHRGLSGPAILQISSYWNQGQSIQIDLVPGADVLAAAKTARKQQPTISPAAFLSNFLPKRLAQTIAKNISYQRLADMSDPALGHMAQMIQNWKISPIGTEGYRIAEVTRGGVDTNEISSKTMQAKSVPGLFFIGEVLDVTGHLGGHNFQWAWASAISCARAL